MNTTYLHASVKQIIGAVEAGLLTRADANAICEDRLSRNATKPQTLKLAEWLATQGDTGKAKSQAKAKPAQSTGRARGPDGKFTKGGAQAKPQAEPAEDGWTPAMRIAAASLAQLTPEQAMEVIASVLEA